MLKKYLSKKLVKKPVRLLDPSIIELSKEIERMAEMNRKSKDEKLKLEGMIAGKTKGMTTVVFLDELNQGKY